MLDGFDSLKIIVGHLDLKDFSEVNPINAFQNLNIVCGDLVLDEVPATETFICFSNLQFVGGNLSLFTNLDTLIGFNHLDSIVRL